MNFAVIGSGGREHAICYKLKAIEQKLKKLICIPGNAGTHKICKKYNTRYYQILTALYEVIRRTKQLISLLLDRSSLWLNGLVDYLNKKKIKSFWSQTNLLHN